MSDVIRASSHSWYVSTSLRLGLFVIAVSLAAYIPYKYISQLHATEGLYAFMFPLSGILALAGIILAVRPQMACDCSEPVRSGVGILAGLWMITGVMCASSLAAMIAQAPAAGLFATFQMTAQHIVLSGALIAFAFAPQRMARLFGALAGSANRSVRLQAQPASNV